MFALHPLASSLGSSSNSAGMLVALVSLFALVVVLRIVVTVVRMLDGFFAAALKVGVAVMAVGTVGLVGAVLYVVALIQGAVPS